MWDELDRKVRAKHTTSATTIAGKLDRNIFSLPPVFSGKNASNLWSSDSGRRGSFWWNVFKSCSDNSAVRELPSRVSFCSSSWISSHEVFYFFARRWRRCTYFYFLSRGINMVNWITMTRKSAEHLCTIYGNTGQLFRPY